VPDQPDQRESPRVDPPKSDANVTSPRDDPGLTTFDVNLSFGSVEPLPATVLSPEVIARLRSDGRLTDAEIEGLQAAIQADSGMVGRFLGGLLATGLGEAREQGAAARSPTPDTAGDDGMKAIPIGEQRFAWTWRGGTPDGEEKIAPATYYEALTGRPDPMRGFFVTARRVLNIVTWLIVLGLPLGLITLGIVIRESPDTIFFMGFFGLIVGLMFRYTLPKTPFG
jgi:hypothetical protein